MEHDYDCIVIGAGIAGLGAALTLQDAGYRTCLLEKDHRVGGRMTTDRMNGFVIDRGVTILGNGFRNMKRMVKRFGLQKHVAPVKFSFALLEDEKEIVFRAKRLDDLLLHHNFSLSTRLGIARLGLDVLLNRNKLFHGMSSGQGHKDNESIAQYMARLNAPELKDRILAPGMSCALGGHFEESSSLILLQTIRNILLDGSWTIDRGLDLIPETMASQLEVKYNSAVSKAEYTKSGVTITTTNGTALKARTLVCALPGHLVPAILPGLPGNILRQLENTRYGNMSSVHLGMDHPVPQKHFGITKRGQNYIIELEHNRCSALCPPGKSMLSIFWWDKQANEASKMNEEEIRRETTRALETCLPAELSHIAFRHHVRLDTGIAHFPVGRLKEMGALRKHQAGWDEPIQLCGDYLDGISSEGALQTGIEAGNHLISFLKRH